MGMGQVVYALKAKKIVLFQKVAAATRTNMRVKRWNKGDNMFDFVFNF